MRINSPEVLGHAVRDMRKALKLTQPELAMTAGTGTRFILELEKGKPTCQLGKALTVLATLGATLEVSPPGGAPVEPPVGLGKKSSDGTDA